MDTVQIVPDSIDSLFDETYLPSNGFDFGVSPDFMETFFGNLPQESLTDACGGAASDTAQCDKGTMSSSKAKQSNTPYRQLLPRNASDSTPPPLMCAALPNSC